MIEIDVPDINWHEAGLTTLAETRGTPGNPDSEQSSSSGSKAEEFIAVAGAALSPTSWVFRKLNAGVLKSMHISIGEPIVLRITDEHASNDPTLLRYLRETEQQFSFVIVRLGATFNTATEHSLETARVEVKMEREDRGQPAPIVWSMEPDRVTDTVHQSRSIELGPELKFASAFKVAGSREESRKEFFLEAFNILQPDPYWLFSAPIARK